MKYKLLTVLFLAFVLRLALIPVAHHGDLNNNISWGDELIYRGSAGYYGSSDANDWPYSAPNQPPLYILLFGFAVWAYKFIDIGTRHLNELFTFFPSSFIWFWEIRGMDYLVKMPGILSDLGIGMTMYWYLKKYPNIKNIVGRKKLLVKPILITTVWLFNPVVWYSSAIWGQTDSLVNFLGLISLIFLLRKKLICFFVVFTIALLFKGSLLIFVPILIAIILKHKYSLKEYLYGIVASLFVIFISSIWFHPYVDFPIWIVKLYFERILPGEIGYLTANAFNFWWLVDSGKVLDSTLYLGLSARIWSLVVTGLSVLSLSILFIRHKLDDKKTFLTMAVVSLITFLFLTRIHERYLYPFFPFATILISFIPNFWIPYVILSIVHLLNLYHLFWAPSIPLFEKLYLHTEFANTLSLITIGMLLWISHNVVRSRK